MTPGSEKSHNFHLEKGSGRVKTYFYLWSGIVKNKLNLETLKFCQINMTISQLK